MLSLLERVLQSPRAYVAFQKSWGASRLREKSVAALGAIDGERVLDIGCGPAYLLDYLPAVLYVGFDIHPRYLAYARRRYGSRANFVLGAYDDGQRRLYSPFDGVLILGVLHHLSDVEATKLLAIVAKSLSPGGRVITLDPCFTPHQSRMARFLAANDRGAYVRDAEGYQQLARRAFGSIESTVLEKVCRLPSTEIIMKLSRPLPLNAHGAWA